MGAADLEKEKTLEQGRDKGQEKEHEWEQQHEHKHLRSLDDTTVLRSCRWNLKEEPSRSRHYECRGLKA